MKLDFKLYGESNGMLFDGFSAVASFEVPVISDVSFIFLNLYLMYDFFRK